MPNFICHVFFSHGKTNSFGILTVYFGKETFTVKKKTDKEGRILILDISVNDSKCILLIYITLTPKKSKSMGLVTCLHY